MYIISYCCFVLKLGKVLTTQNDTKPNLVYSGTRNSDLLTFLLSDIPLRPSSGFQKYIISYCCFVLKLGKVLTTQNDTIPNLVYSGTRNSDLLRFLLSDIPLRPSSGFQKYIISYCCFVLK